MNKNQIFTDDHPGHHPKLYFKSNTGLHHNKNRQLVFLFLNVNAMALGPEDFFCSEALWNQGGGVFAHYFGLHTKVCDGKNTTTASAGLCVMSVNCAYFSDELKEKLLKKHPKQKFNLITDDQKKKFLEEEPTVEWLPSSISCTVDSKSSEVEVNSQGKKAKTHQCPVPQKCKDDIRTKFIPAMMDDDALMSIQERYLKGTSEVFPLKSSDKAKE